ncbi:MAG: DUF748 domain-containing protein [Holophagaceae bacterium]|nr:DUF748 domain-containing protein [Holophagaceae bacterium]
MSGRSDEKSFKLLIRDLALSGFRLGWEDPGAARPVKVEATEMNLHLQGFSWIPRLPSRAELDLRLGPGL